MAHPYYRSRGPVAQTLIACLWLLGVALGVVIGTVVIALLLYAQVAP